MNAYHPNSRWPRAQRRCWAVALALALASQFAHAAVSVPCDEPMVLPDARVQVFIIPYRAEGRLSEQGRRLATVLQRHVLFAALKYPSIAVEELTGGGPECNFETVSRRVAPRLREGQSAIFLHGRLFEQGDEIRLQSSVAFVDTRGKDRISWGMGHESATDVVVALPSDPVMFAPRTIPLRYLEFLERAQLRARSLHDSPDPESGYWTVPDDAHARLIFQVIGTSGDWMHVRMPTIGREGWLEAHSLADAGEIKGIFPELYFVDGLIGYLQLRPTAEGPSPANRKRLSNAAAASLERYIDSTRGRAESETRAFAWILKGVTLLRAESSAADPAVPTPPVHEAFREARKLAPAATDANRFFLASALARCERGECEGGADQLHAEFLDAIAQDPTNTELLENLKAFYSLAKAGDLKLNLAAGDIAKQSGRVTRSLESRNMQPEQPEDE